MMLNSYIFDEQNKEKVIQIFMNAKNLKVKRITYFYDDQMYNSINAYIAKKEEGIKPEEVFPSLWLKNAIWEEDLENFGYTKEECEQIYEDVFLASVSGFDLEDYDVLKAKNYIAKTISKELKKIKSQNIYAEDEKAVSFLDISGVYVNKKYTLKPVSIMNVSDEILSATKLCENNDLGEYKEFFLETKERYIYFF